MTVTDRHTEALVEYDPVTFKLNRYSDIIPCKIFLTFLDKHSLVKLPEEEKIPKNLNYVNGNYICDPHTGEKNVFIATQGPIPNSFVNFWRMVWHSNIYRIVMLCGLKEDGRVQCDVYWPDESLSKTKISVGEWFEVKLKKTDKSNSFYWVREFELKNLKVGETRTVYQYHVFFFKIRLFLGLIGKFLKKNIFLIWKS